MSRSKVTPEQRIGPMSRKVQIKCRECETFSVNNVLEGLLW